MLLDTGVGLMEDHLANFQCVTLLMSTKKQMLEQQWPKEEDKLSLTAPNTQQLWKKFNQLSILVNLLLMMNSLPNTAPSPNLAMMKLKTTNGSALPKFMTMFAYSMKILIQTISTRARLVTVIGLLVFLLMQRSLNKYVVGLR